MTPSVPFCVLAVCFLAVLGCQCWSLKIERRLRQAAFWSGAYAAALAKVNPEDPAFEPAVCAVIRAHGKDSTLYNEAVAGRALLRAQPMAPKPTPKNHANSK